MPHRDPTELGPEARAALAMSLLDTVRDRVPPASSALDAFLQAREETSADFFRSFLTLSVSERRRLLAEHEEDEAPDSATGPAPEPVLSTAMETLLFEKPNQMDMDRALATHVVTDAPDLALADMDDLEEIDLTTVQDVHTGRMVAFFDHGDTTDTTVFDNYFDDADTAAAPDAVPSATQTADAERVELDPDEMARLLKNASTLEDFLRLSSGDEEVLEDAAHEVPAASVDVAVAVQDPVETNDQSRDIAASESPLSTDEDESDEPLQLPGLEEDSADSAPSPKKKSSVTLDPTMQTSLRALAAEPDDGVYTFALDPLYDYDADLVGESFRRGSVDRKQLK